MFSKILIANRGEIAVRIIRACREMGISTVAVFSEADRDALHVSLADESYCIGPYSSKDSYLNMHAVLSAAEVSGAEAIHPGYGFLSENHLFAELCGECGIAFIGPPPAAIKAMGDKTNARAAMERAGVPVTPGCKRLTDASHAQAEGDRIGYPLLIKAGAGGGGRGIRLINRREDVPAAFAAASAEAKAYFSDDSLYMEKYLTDVKHIEVQVLCDNFGNAVAFPERECSVQRRHQKLVEESPSPAVDGALRAAMQKSAVTAASAAGYRSAGTVEFLLDRKTGSYYFMEMNTRLQVEHGITEMLTGIDLVKWQIRVAANVKLTFSQEDITSAGHVIECRINAENACSGRPSCGAVDMLHVPGGPWVRFDSALYQGYKIPPFYDSLIGKLMVFAAERDEAVRKMLAALGEMVIDGIQHNGEIYEDILASPTFADGTYNTAFMDSRDTNLS